MGAPQTKPKADLLWRDEGSIWLLLGNTPAGDEWLEQQFGDRNDVMRFGNAIVVEHRFVDDIDAGACSDGLSTNYWHDMTR